MTEHGQVADFLRTMRCWTAGVTVVSATTEDGKACAMTATSFTSVSLEPPSVLICVNDRASLHPVLLAGRPFCVNLLGQDQRRVAETCSREGMSEERFDDPGWSREAVEGFVMPWLKDAAGNLFCRQLERMKIGSHSVVIGEVAAIRGSHRAPLFYLNGSYRHLPEGGF